MATRIVGIDHLSDEEVSRAVQEGGRFVIYLYTISIIVMTFKRSSNIHFVTADQNRIVKGLGFTALTALLGWWGIPWGPIYTIQSLVTNLGGGKDVTDAVMGHQHSALAETFR